MDPTLNKKDHFYNGLVRFQLSACTPSNKIREALTLLSKTRTYHLGFFYTFDSIQLRVQLTN